MKRNSALAHFSRDHHKALIISQVIRKNAPSYRGMPDAIEGKVSHVIRFFDEELADHFRKEETILFPFIKDMDSRIDSLVDELIVDHRSIESLVQQLKSNSEAESLLDQLGSLMESHIRKEERILFQQLQETLSEDEFNRLEEMLIRNENDANDNIP
jgi:iron-sulfur cluster repair protein YtfE (RIC family)